MLKMTQVSLCFSLRIVDCTFLFKQSHSVISSKDYEYPNQQSQSTQHQKNDRCPPPPQMLPERACEVPGCRSDSECERHKRCCYNGCIYACLESVQPPPGKHHRSSIQYTKPYLSTHLTTHMVIYSVSMVLTIGTRICSKVLKI